MRAVPPTPDAAVRGYYRFPPPSTLWMYYDGATWVGDAHELPWWRKPVDGAFGRATRGSFAIIGVLMVVVIAANILFARG